MRLRQFRRVILEEVGADIGFSCIIVGHGGMQLRGSDSAVNAAIRVRRLVQLQCQDGTDELIRFALGAEEISQGIGHKGLAAIHRGFPLGILHHMRVRAQNNIRTPVGKLLGEVTPLFDKEQYCEMVEKAKHHIKEGDIFQIVLSNRLSAPFEGSLFDTYRVLRTINPSPYMFYFSGTDVEVAGASPETLVKLENGVLHTFPLAGTRPRGATEEEDKELEAGLLADEKELAEHNMLVDLGRNDLGKVSKFGSVKVEKLHSIERYSHVMHIGSTVRGEIREEYDALDAIEAVLPAGTLSGAPKIRACQLIGELEDNKRGIYGGAIGYIDFTGNMDTCIAIRIAYKKNGKVFVRSGAGIVADSDPEKEFQECINKAKASLKALEVSQEVEE